MGLFGRVSSIANIQNLTLANVSITANGGAQVGGLVGLGNSTVTLLKNITVSGNVTGANRIAGIAGEYNGMISNSSSSAAVTANNYYYAGGIVGRLNPGGRLTSVTSSGVISGSHGVGGLVGLMQGGTITSSSTTGSLVGLDNTTDTNWFGGFSRIQL